MNPGYPTLNSLDTVVDLRKHSATDISISHQLMSLWYCQFRNQCGWILWILIDSFNICQKCKLLCFHSFCNRTCCIICINIVCIVVIVQSYRANDRKEIFFQKIVKNIRIYICHITDKSDIFTICIFFLYREKSSVFSTDADRADSQALYKLNKTFIYLAQNHLSQLHSCLIGHTKSILKFRFHTNFSNPTADFLTAAMYDDWLKSDQF